jgi:hypothetical protein
MPRVSKTKPVEIERPKGPFVVIGIITLGLLATGSTILWAQYDDGQIDVSATIAQSRANAEGGEGGGGNTAPTAPSQEFTKMTNGGLQAQAGGAPEPQPVPEQTATDTASSTGTTTEDGTNGEETSEMGGQGEGGQADSVSGGEEATTTESVSTEGDAVPSQNQ